MTDCPGQRKGRSRGSPPDKNLLNPLKEESLRPTYSASTAVAPGGPAERHPQAAFSTSRAAMET
jgi:hypothetical protein